MRSNTKKDVKTPAHMSTENCKEKKLRLKMQRGCLLQEIIPFATRLREPAGFILRKFQSCIYPARKKKTSKSALTDQISADLVAGPSRCQSTLEEVTASRTFLSPFTKGTRAVAFVIRFPYFSVLFRGQYH